MRSKSIFAQFVAPTRSRRWAAVCLALYMLGLGLSATAQDDRRATIITFDVPGASQVTQAFGINPAGTIVGYYAVLNDQIFVYHGFLRTKDGTFTTIDAPGAGTGMFQGTFAFNQGTFTASVIGLNPAGAIAGAYTDSGFFLHGYVRAADGHITTFDVAGAEGTNASGINPAGAIPGVYFDSNGVNHGYVRTKQGAITTFDVPAAGTGAFQGTLPESINPSGAITGQYLDASGVNHGFLRDKHGVITTFDAPGAGTGAGQGTFPTTNNPSDAITGYYMDANSAFHGFLRIP